MNINIPLPKNRFNAPNSERDLYQNNNLRLPPLNSVRSYQGSLNDLTIMETSMALNSDRPKRNNIPYPPQEEPISRSIVIPDQSYKRFDTSFNAQIDHSYSVNNRQNPFFSPPPQRNQLAYVGQRSLPELSPPREYQPQQMGNVSLSQNSIMMPSNLPFYPGYQIPVFAKPVQKKKTVEDSKILKHIEKQNQMIEQLAFKLGEQQRDYFDREKRELEEKLRLMQMESNLKLQEMKIREMVTNNQSKPEEKPEKKKKPREKKKYFDILGELLLSKEVLKKGDLFALKESDGSDNESDHKPSQRESPRKQGNFSNRLRLDLSPQNNNSLNSFNPMENNNYYGQGSPNREFHHDSPTKINYQSPRGHYPIPNGNYSPSKRPFIPLGESPPSPHRNPYYGNHGHGYPMPHGNHYPYPPNHNPYAYGNYHNGYPMPYVQPFAQGQNMQQGDPTLSNEELARRKKKRATTIRKKKEDEAEAEQAPEEEKKPVKDTAAIRSRLRRCLWAITYSQLLFSDVRNKVEKRKHQIQEEMSNLISANFNTAQEWLLNIATKYILAVKFAQEKKSLELYNSKKNISDKDLDNRINIIIANYKQLFDKMIVNTNETVLPQNLLRFLASISEDSGVLPSGFMFDFEVKRLQFTYYATLKNMTPLKSKMVIGCFILLRILLHKLIMRPWQSIHEIEESSVNKQNLLTVGSILYHAVLDFYRSNLQVFTNNQSFLPAELKVRARTIPLTAEEANPYEQEDRGVTIKRTGTIIIKELEPIVGFYTKEQLRCFFFDRKKKYDELRALIDGWLEKIYQLTRKIYEATPKEERETLGFPK